MRKSNFVDEFTRYQAASRCRPAQDLRVGLANGAGVGAAGGALTGGLLLGVPLLPVLGLGVVTGVLGAAAGAVAGGVVGTAVGGLGGGVTALAHAHIHAPERGKLRRHVFSRFGVVPMRHQSARIVRHLEKGGVLAVGARTVRHPGRVDRALRDVRVFGKPLTPAQKSAIAQIILLQAGRGQNT